MGFSFEYFNLDGVEVVDNDESGFDVNWNCMETILNLLDRANVLDKDLPCPDFETFDEDDNDPRLAVRSLDTGRVPVFKLSSSDGWHILPDEATIIGTSLIKALVDDTDEVVRELEEEDMKFYLEFADFCLRSSQHDGFRVF